MAYILIILLIFTSSCGLKVKTDPIKVEPVDVNHKISVNIESLKDFYEGICISTLPNPHTQLELDNCINSKVEEFLTAFDFSS